MKKIGYCIVCLMMTPVWAGGPLSVADAIKTQKQYGTSCSAPERGKITKVDVVDAQGVQKLTRGGMKAAPGKYLVTYVAKGKQTDFSISATPIDASATANDFKSLVGTPGCLPADEE